jgi:hypothetical protein
VVGYFGDIPFDAFETAALTFEDNRYTGSGNGSLFLDHGDEIDFEQWQESGRDVGSTYTEDDS